MKNKFQSLKFDPSLWILLRLIFMIPFNFFLIFIPATVVLTLIVLAWALVFLLVILSVAFISEGFKMGLMAVSFWMTTSLFSASFFSFFFSVVLGFVMVFMTKHFSLFVVNYLQWNLNFIRGKS